METMNHEYYVSLEVAKLLKEAGFDWDCYELYAQYGRVHSVTSANWNSSSKYYSAPTFDVTQRYLREEWDLIITIEYSYHTNVFTCKVYSKAECLSILFDFSVYEQAQEAGIKKALEIILDKNNSNKQ